MSISYQSSTLGSMKRSSTVLTSISFDALETSVATMIAEQRDTKGVVDSISTSCDAIFDSCGTIQDSCREVLLSCGRILEEESDIRQNTDKMQDNFSGVSSIIDNVKLGVECVGADVRSVSCDLTQISGDIQECLQKVLQNQTKICSDVIQYMDGGFQHLDLCCEGIRYSVEGTATQVWNVGNDVKSCISLSTKTICENIAVNTNRISSHEDEISSVLDSQLNELKNTTNSITQRLEKQDLSIVLIPVIDSEIKSIMESAEVLKQQTKDVTTQQIYEGIGIVSSETDKIEDIRLSVIDIKSNSDQIQNIKSCTDVIPDMKLSTDHILSIVDMIGEWKETSAKQIYDNIYEIKTETAQIGNLASVDTVSNAMESLTDTMNSISSDIMVGIHSMSGQIFDISSFLSCMSSDVSSVYNKLTSVVDGENSPLSCVRKDIREIDEKMDSIHTLSSSLLDGNDSMLCVVNKKIEAVQGEIDGKVEIINSTVDEINGKLDRVDSTVNQIQEAVNNISAALNTFINGFSSILQNEISQYEIGDLKLGEMKTMKLKAAYEDKEDTVDMYVITENE